jgi:hypothetical protein
LDDLQRLVVPLAARAHLQDWWETAEHRMDHIHVCIALLYCWLHVSRPVMPARSVHRVQKQIQGSRSAWNNHLFRPINKPKKFLKHQQTICHKEASGTSGVVCRISS